MTNKLPFDWGSRTYVMGILNITPDSFSGDGLLKGRSGWGREKGRELAGIIERARYFAAAGADVLDVGGESTRPGAQSISEDEELKRVIPVIRALISEVNIPISIDTYKSKVAELALEEGALMVNDVWGLRADPELGSVVARYQVPIVLVHNRLRPSSHEVIKRLEHHPLGSLYDHLIEDVKNELMESVKLAREAGISDRNIILDPGVGFGKTVTQSLELIDRLDEFRALGFPLLLGSSRKGFIGRTLDLPPERRLEGTAATIAIGIDRGADIVRVHDVEEIVRVARMTDAIVRRKNGK